MWFAKWFGGRSVQEDDEPARFAPPASARTVAPVARVQGKVGGEMKRTAAKQVKSGFDPYNSGNFDRNRAWERVLR
jgi:hypothetical protein